MICIYLFINSQVSAMVGSIYILAFALIACAYGQQPSNQHIFFSVFGNKTKKVSPNEQPTNVAVNVRSSCIV